MQDRDLPVLPHQREALNRAREPLDAARPHAATDLGAVFQRQPELVREAAEGRSQAAVRAMQREADIRADPFQHAERFVEGWRQLQRVRENLQRDGDFRGARKVSEQMTGMAKSLERDAQMESLLRGRRHELGIGVNMGRSLARDLADSMPLDRGRDLCMSRSEEKMENGLQPYEPQADPATRAFARLEGEMALMRRAVEHLAAEKADIDVPDYSNTLGEMAKRLISMEGKPAMQMTPEDMAARIEAAAVQARRGDQAALAEAKQKHVDAVRALWALAGTAATIDAQHRRLRWWVGGGLLTGCLLWSFLPGVVLRAMPDGWRLPENMARHIIGEPTLWEAGTRLMQADSPAASAALTKAAEMLRDNRDSIEKCQRKATKAGKPVRCTVEISY